MSYKSVVFACSVAVFALPAAPAVWAQTAPTTPASTLQDAAQAYARGDYPAARAIFQSLAARGDMTAQFDLAVMNASGQGAAPNLQEALKWYRAAGEQGDAESFTNLAALFENGSGVPVDYVKAYVLFDTAARLARGNTVQGANGRRDSLAVKMSTAQLIQAQDLARQCRAEPVKACSARVLDSEAAFTPGNQALDTPMVIKLEQDHGTFVAPLTMNGTTDLKFVVDSGASDVVIPTNVLTTLMASGSVSKNDFIDEAMVTLADGSKKKAQRYRVRSLKIGDLVLDNVTVAIAPANATPLLGQSFLSRLKSWSMDNASHTLTIK